MNAPSLQDAQTSPYRWVMLAMICVAYASFGMVQTSIAPLITPILHDTGMTRGQMGIALGSWQFVYLFVAIPAGAIIDRWGLRRAIFFGIAFVALEIREFVHLFHEGAPPWRSAFLSSFYTLVSTHGLHVSFGILWLVTLMVQVQRYGLVAANKRRLMCLSMFWHFLDLIWIGVFTVVYLIGVLE